MKLQFPLIGSKGTHGSRAWDLETLINSLSEAVLLLDKSNRIVFVNKTGEEFFGKSHQEIIGARLTDLYPGAKTIARLARKAMKELRSFSVKDAEVKLNGISSVDMDITPYLADDKCSGVLLSIRENLSIAERGDFPFDSLVYLLGTIAHEIKNPLGGIKGAAQLLKGRLLKGNVHVLTGTDTADEYINLIIRETDRLNTVLQNYLTMSRRPALQEMNIHEILEKAISIMDALLKNVNISVYRVYDPSLPRVIGDGGKLLQVFLNVIKNGVEAMPRGGSLSIATKPSAEYAVQHGQIKRWAVVSIRDTGRGIPKHEMQKIFLPFYTKKKKGTGLGLALSKKIIKDHNGFMRVERPESGKGTVFHIYIPFAM
ncbi:MAG TPA: ATP-binding protein [Thermodesulfovibrionales bacterium]|nr:ATP-binding protein [Thermodesulfovibrionales bacterium]